MTGETWFAIAVIFGGAAWYGLSMRHHLSHDTVDFIPSLMARYGLVSSGGTSVRTPDDFTITLHHGASVGGQISVEWTMVVISGGLPEDVVFRGRRWGQRRDRMSVPSGVPHFDRAVLWSGSPLRLRALGPSDRDVVQRAARCGWRANGGRLRLELAWNRPSEKQLREGLDLGLEVARMLRGSALRGDIGSGGDSEAARRP
jgi:hypothetical protein